MLAFAADDEVDVRRLCVGIDVEARVVAADDNPRGRTQRADERDDLQCGVALERHHRQADHVRGKVSNHPLDRRPDR
jgi:hypothetical protein